MVFQELARYYLIELAILFFSLISSEALVKLSWSKSYLIVLFPCVTADNECTLSNEEFEVRS